MRVPAALLALPLLTGCALGIASFDSHPESFALLTASAALFAWLGAAGSFDDNYAPATPVALVVCAAFGQASRQLRSALDAVDTAVAARNRERP